MKITKSRKFKSLKDLKKLNPNLVERLEEYMNDICEPFDDSEGVVVHPPHIADYLKNTKDSSYYYFDTETRYAIREDYEDNLVIL